MTPHIEAKKEEIADFVLMPGDPLRAKYIADNFLEDVIQVNSIRNMIAFTGSYKGKRITVFPSGMGIPSMGIYSYELFKFYDVQTILRLGSCGALTTDLDLLDTVLVESTFSESNYALSMCNVQEHVAQASVELNKKILETSNKRQFAQKANVFCCVDDFSAAKSDDSLCGVWQSECQIDDIINVDGIQLAVCQNFDIGFPQGV